MKKIVVILLCIWTMIFFAGCKSSVVHENPFTKEESSTKLNENSLAAEEVKRRMETAMENEIDEPEASVSEEDNNPSFLEKNETSDSPILPSKEVEYETIDDEGYLSNGCYFQFCDMSIDES